MVAVASGWSAIPRRMRTEPDVPSIAKVSAPMRSSYRPVTRAGSAVAWIATSTESRPAWAPSGSGARPPHRPRCTMAGSSSRPQSVSS